MGSGDLCVPANNYIYKTAMQTKEVPLPTGVRPKHGSYFLVVQQKWIKLCRITDGRAKLYEALAEVRGLNAQSVWSAILSYLKHGMGSLKPATQKHYRTTGLRMLHHWGHFILDEVEPTHCAQYLKWCRDEGRAVTGNREKSFMSSVFEYAMGEGWCASNPFRGVRRNKERRSTSYVEHEQFVTTMDRAPPHLYALMGIAYILGIRQTDLRLLTKAAITKRGIEVTESKTGKKNTHEISSTVNYLLRIAFDHAEAVAVQHEKKGRHAKAAAVRAQPYVFLSKRGLPLSEWGLQSALRRFKPGFQFRKLRNKAQSDSEKNILGHSGAMRSHYEQRRKLSAVK